VTEPVGLAFEHVKRVLFQPFDLGKWFTIGFCAWLAYLGEAGGGSRGSYNFGNHQQTHISDFHQAVDQARDWLTNNLAWVVPLAAFVIVLMLGLWLLFLWLSSRGKFMFLHCVALNRAEVSEPWNQFAPEANSLFVFRVILGLTGMVVTLPLLIIMGMTVFKMFYRGGPNPGNILLAVGLGLISFLIIILFAIIKKFMVDFVVPVMYLRRNKCLEAWNEFCRLLAAHAGLFVLYILFQIVLAMAIGAVVVMVILLTCCIAGCLLALPYLGTVLLLPVLMFKRAYALYFLAQFGPEYDVFPPPPPPPVPPPPPPAPGLPPMPIAPPTG